MCFPKIENCFFMKWLINILLSCISFSCFSQTNLILNGDFGLTGSSWIATGNFQYNSTFATWHYSPGYAYLADFSGLPANNISGSLSQSFFVPSGTAGVNVSFWFRITSSDNTTAIHDTCRVTLINLSTGISTDLGTLSNLDKNTAYTMASAVLPGIPTGVNWKLQFTAGNDATMPTVFRIDDVAVTTLPPTTTACVSWTGGILPSPMVDSAMEKLCAYGIVSSSQTASNLSLQITRLDVARYLGKARIGTGDISFLDNFPSIFPALQSLSLTDQRYVKLMLFLEYPTSFAPGYGTDNISPFSRDCFYTTFDGPMKKSDVIKAMIETWNLPPLMIYYDPTSTAISSTICDMQVSNKNLGWVQSAYGNHLLDGITTPCIPGGSIYLNDVNLTYSDFYVMLSKLIDHTPSPIGYDAFFTPNLFYLTNNGGNASLEKGVFSEYSSNGFSIPSGGIGLEFNHSYHSNLTEIPFLNNDTDVENTYLKPKLQPLGGGWTHSYSTYIKSLGPLGTTPDRILIYWPDGEVHSYLVGLSKYETKGITDKLFIDSYNTYSQPQNIRILKGRTTYTFQNIDPVGYNVLSLVSITDAYGNSLGLQYSDGYSAIPGLAPKILTKITDSFSSRSLTLAYLPGTNYLQSVTDPIGRTLTFKVNKYNHDLDSAADAKGQYTKYDYFEYIGTFAYRTHLLTSIRKPKGNIINNNYFNRKLSQTAGADYLINVAAVPGYQTAWTQQNNQVTRTQSGQTITTNYTFDVSGNQTQISTPSQSVTSVYDTASNRPLIVRDLNMGFITKYSYDVNGFLNRNVLVDSLFGDSTVNEYTNNSYGEVIDTKDYNDPTGIITETKDYRNTKGKDSIIVTNEFLGGEIRHQFGYYSNGLLASYISPTSYQINYDYNSYGNVHIVYKYPSVFTDPIITENYTYDAVSRLITHADYMGLKTAYLYDNNDNPTDVTVDPDTLNLTTHSTYDANDNVLSITSPKGHTTTLTYDYYTDDLIQENDGTDKKRWTYNEDGTVDSFITKNNFAFKHSYYNPAISPDSTLAGLLFSDGIAIYQYWSKTKNVYHINNSLSQENHFWYDASFQRSKWNKPGLVSTGNIFAGSPAPPDNVYYEYDRMMRPSKIGYPLFGTTDYLIDYNYDFVTKKLETVQNEATYYTYANYAYKKDGSPTSVAYGNGDSIFYHYDSYNRQDSIWAKNSSGTILYSIGASIDKNGNHTRENLEIYFAGTLDTTLPNLTIGDSGSYTYQLRNRIITGEGKSFILDNGGNVTSSTPPLLSCTWSPYNQLTSINRGGVVTNYSYDPMGIRRMKDNTFYVVDQQNTGNVIMEATHSTTPINAYVWGNGLVCRIDPISDSVFYYHFDFRGNVIAITNQSGNLVKFYKYDPFGKVYKSGGSLSWQNPYQYVGKEGVQTDDSDLYYMKARYYQPSTGRFISEDPKWNTNLFVYCDDDPIDNFDPKGSERQNIDPSTADITNTAIGVNLSLNEGALNYTARNLGGLDKIGLDVLNGTKLLGTISGITGIGISIGQLAKNPTSIGAWTRLGVNVGLTVGKDVDPFVLVGVGVLDLTGTSDKIYNSMGNFQIKQGTKGRLRYR